LVAENTELQQALSFAKHAIIGYYGSTSWKMTKPLRRIIKKLRGDHA